MTEPHDWVGPLSQLKPADREALLASGRRRVFRVDEVVLGQGSRNASLFVITQGVLHVRRRSAEGRRVLLGRLQPGSCFGEISVFDPGPTTADVVAVTAGELVEIRREQLDAFARSHPEALVQLLAGLIETMAQRMRHTDDRLVEAIFWSGLLREPSGDT